MPLLKNVVGIASSNEEESQESKQLFIEEKNEPVVRWQKDLPRDLWIAISEFLTFKEFGSFFLTCKELNMSREKSLWRAKCVQLWRHKLVKPEFVLLAKGRDGKPREAFQRSRAEGLRTIITLEEIHDTTWHIIYRPELFDRFLAPREGNVDQKEKSALEPYFKYGKTRQRKLLPYGRIVTTGEVPESVFIVESMKQWRWQLVEKGTEQYLVYTSPIQSFPPCRVSRMPNWGWAMQSVIVLWLSFPPGEKALELAERDLE